MDAAKLPQGQAKLDEARRLIGALKDDIVKHELSPSDRSKYLQTLKIFGHNPSGAEPIYSKDGIATLSHYGFEEENQDVYREALRCIANGLLLVPAMRQIFVDLGNAPKTADLLAKPSSDDEFLASRLIFFTTYGTKADFNDLFDKHGLASNVNKHIQRHTEDLCKSSSHFLEGIENLTLIETLKLIFNLCHFNPQRCLEFQPSLANVIAILNTIDIPSPPMSPPVNSLISALIILDEKTEDFDTPIVNKLISILEQTVSAKDPPAPSPLAPSTEALTILPLVALLRKVISIASDGIKADMRSRLLPSDEERDQPLGKSDTLPSKLLKLITGAQEHSTRDCVAGMFFELSNQNPLEFVQNVGYGFASGYLMNHSIEVPEEVRSSSSFAKEPSTPAASSSSNAGPSASTSIPINPVTGQRLDAEREPEGPPMSKEEKEREAERLFVLFQRLKSNGIFQGQDPISQAVESGRFEELPDDSDSDDD